MNSYEPSAEDIQALVDGELSPDDATRVRAALARSPRARAELDECLQLAALAHALRATASDAHRWAELAVEPTADSAAPDVIPIRRAPRRPRTRTVVLAVVTSLLSAAAVLAFWGGGGRHDSRGLVASAESAFAGALSPRRGIEPRLSWQPADRWRPYDTARAAGEHPAETFSFDLLARIEKLRDPRAMTAARVLANSLQDAPALGNGPQVAPPLPTHHSADADSDRATIALVAHRPEEALLAAAAALESDPHHVQATWNRALALERLGMPLTAAEAFEAVASRKEPGWSQEASERAAGLRAQLARRQAAWKNASAAGERMVAGGPPDDATAAAYPGLMRLYFYDAVRAAASADRVRALRPLAAALDARSQGHDLAAYVDRIARVDFRRRGPLAARYAELARGGITDPGAVEALLAALRAAHQDDMLLGALLHSSPTGWRPDRERLGEYVALAQATRDPWFELESAANRAWTALQTEDSATAQTVLAAVAPRCEAAGAMDYLCMDIYRLLTHVYILLHRPDAARSALDRSRKLARSSGNVTRETELLYYSYQVAAFTDDTSASLIDLSTAYLDEWSRESDDCADQHMARQWKAITLINRNRLDAARRELALEPSACKVPLTPGRAYLPAQLLRRGGDDGAVLALRREIAGLRGSRDTSPGDRAFLDYVEGLLLADRSPAEARGLLRRAIEASDDLPGDVAAIKARSYSYSILIEEAVARGASDEALALLAEQRALPAPTRCALGAQSEIATTSFVARGASGAAVGVQLAREPGTQAGAQAVPVTILAALDGCESVDVLASQPYYGRPELLPREMAWAFRTGAPERAAPTGPARPVVVANIDPPASLGLAPLRPIADAPGAALLEGPAATPDRVMAAAASATFLEIHAHGLLGGGGWDAVGEEDTSLLVLAPDAQGRYALGGTEIRRARLRGSPVVVLASCHASAIGHAFHSTWGLADAFIEAGARAVIASPDPIQDAGAGAFFSALRARVTAGETPVAALRAERLAHGNSGERIWIDRLVAFQ